LSSTELYGTTNPRNAVPTPNEIIDLSREAMLSLNPKLNGIFDYYFRNSTDAPPQLASKVHLSASPSPSPMSDSSSSSYNTSTPSFLFETDFGLPLKKASSSSSQKKKSSEKSEYVKNDATRLIAIPSGIISGNGKSIIKRPMRHMKNKAIAAILDDIEEEEEECSDIMFAESDIKTLYPLNPQDGPKIQVLESFCVHSNAPTENRKKVAMRSMFVDENRITGEHIRVGPVNTYDRTFSFSQQFLDHDYAASDYVSEDGMEIYMRARSSDDDDDDEDINLDEGEKMMEDKEDGEQEEEEAVYKEFNPAELMWGTGRITFSFLDWRE
jgi:hypothetical protein